MSAIVMDLPRTRVCSAHLAYRIASEEIHEALLIRRRKSIAEMPWQPGDLVGRWRDRIIGEPDPGKCRFAGYWIATGEPVAFDAQSARMSVPVMRITGNNVDALLEMD